MYGLLKLKSKCKENNDGDIWYMIYVWFFKDEKNKKEENVNLVIVYPLFGERVDESKLF